MHTIMYSSTKNGLAAEDQPKLFERIDASKLQGALSNATVMGQLEVRLNKVTIGCVCVHVSNVYSS